MTNIELIENYIRTRGNEARATNNLSYSNNILYSYQTAIAEWTMNGVIVNTTQYSPTTSKHRNALIGLLNAYNHNPTFIDNVAIGQQYLSGDA